VANIQKLRTVNGMHPTLTGISRPMALQLFQSMLRIRKTQEALINEYHPADEMRCPIHFCVGQEAIPVGVSSNLRADDYTFSGHRSHGYYLAKGGSLKGMFAEFYGKSTGSNSGKAGHQEISDESVNFYSGTILVGMLAIAAGAALASQMRGENRVAVTIFGDGGADEGIVYETLNFAALNRLPMVFICENNGYSIYSNQSSRQALSDLSGRARAFGVSARRLDGNDVTGVYRAAKRAIDKARRGDGPTLLELDTYRWCGHVGPEDDDHLGYRTEEELQSWIARCPIEGMKSSLLKAGLLQESEVGDLEKEISLEIADAFSFAKSSPFPKPEVLLKDVFADQDWKNPVSVDELPEIDPDFRQDDAIPRPY
jgi:TPP-dependent pyruvate/acetoin dehydrogenase alpha subunit